MKALVLVDEADDKIAIREIGKPMPGPGEALIRVKAAALNRRDQWCRVGKYPGLKYNTVMGSDGAGVVEHIADNADAHWLGKEVIINPNIDWGSNPEVQGRNYRILGMPENGSFAEYVLVKVDRLHAKPQHLNFAQAAALPLGGLTAFRALVKKGELKPGEKVLVTGIGGGVATFAAQFALSAGAMVFVTSGSDEKLKKAKAMGVHGTFNYKAENWADEAKNESGGFQLIIDSAGGDQLNGLLRLLKPAGRLVFYGATLGMPKNLEVHRFFWNQYTLKGSTMGNDFEFIEMLDFVNHHKIVPVVDSVFPFDKIVEAFNRIDSSVQMGKIVVEF
jgi:zinc-binding alcohol dehydrogenase/oxidoreductase